MTNYFSTKTRETIAKGNILVSSLMHQNWFRVSIFIRVNLKKYFTTLLDNL